MKGHSTGGAYGKHYLRNDKPSFRLRRLSPSELKLKRYRVEYRVNARLNARLLANHLLAILGSSKTVLLTS